MFVPWRDLHLSRYHRSRGIMGKEYTFPKIKSETTGVALDGCSTYEVIRN